MTQPNPGDYVYLGPTSMPQVKTPGSAAGDTNGVDTNGVSVVQMQEQAWRARAKAAQDAADELMRCQQIASDTLNRNYFGEGCAEGEAVYAALQDAITSSSGWNGQLIAQIARLQNLAASCKSAADRLTFSDGTAAHGLTST